MTSPKPLSGRFHFVRQIRATKGSVVWLARDAETNKIVVASTIPRARVVGLRKSIGIEHPHMVAVLAVMDTVDPAELPDAGKVKTPAAVAVAEHVEGTTLRERIEEKPVPVEKAVAWVLAIAKAVRVIHEHGGVHGAISPRAVLVTRADGGPVPVLTNLRIPANGAFCSPDRVYGRGPSPEDDVWALYATLFSCLAGTAPFLGKTRTELARNIVRGNYRKLHEIVDEPQLSKIIDDGFIVRVSRRSKTIEDLENKLEAWLRERGLQAAPQPSSLIPPAPAVRRPAVPKIARPAEPQPAPKRPQAPVASPQASNPMAETSLFDDEEDIKTVRMDTKQAIELYGLEGGEPDELASTRRDGWDAHPGVPEVNAAMGEDEEFDDDDDDDQMKTAVFAPNVAKELLQDFEEDDDDEDDEGETQVMHLDDFRVDQEDQLRVLSSSGPPPGLSPSAPVYGDPSSASAASQGASNEPPQSFDPAAALLAGHRDRAGFAPQENMAGPQFPPPAFGEKPPALADASPSQAEQPSPGSPQGQDTGTTGPALPPVQPKPLPQSAIATQQIDAYRPKRRVRWLVWVGLFLLGGVVATFVTIYVMGWQSRAKALWNHWTGNVPTHALPKSSASASTPTPPRGSASPVVSMKAAAGKDAGRDGAQDASGDAEADADAAKDGSAAKVDVQSCVEQFFPGKSFLGPVELDYLCSEKNLPKLADRLQLDIVKGGGGKVSQTMRVWSSLRWYEWMVVAVLRDRCCSHASNLELPSDTGKCTSPATVAQRLAKSICEADDLETRAQEYRKAIDCLYDKNVPRPYRYSTRLQTAQSATFASLVKEGCKRWKNK